MILPWLVLSAVLLAAFYTDCRRFIIPNWLSLSGCVSGMFIHFGLEGSRGISFALSSLSAGFGTLLLLYLFGALGAGDVKLFTAIGALTGVSFVLESVFYSLLFAAVIGVAILIGKRLLLQKMLAIGYALFGFFYMRNTSLLRAQSKTEMTKYPFMYAVIPGVLAAGWSRFG